MYDFSSIRQCWTILSQYIKNILKYAESLSVLTGTGPRTNHLWLAKIAFDCPKPFCVCTFSNYVWWRNNSILIFQDIRSSELVLDNCHSYTTIHFHSFTEIKGGKCLHELLTLSNLTFLSSLSTQKWVSRTFSCGNGGQCGAKNHTISMCRLSWNLGAITSWNPQGLCMPVQGLLHILLFYLHSLIGPDRYKTRNKIVSLSCIEMSLQFWLVVMENQYNEMETEESIRLWQSYFVSFFVLLHLNQSWRWR